MKLLETQEIKYLSLKMFSILFMPILVFAGPISVMECTMNLRL